MLASAGLFDPNVKIWHTETGKEIISLPAGKSPFTHYNAFVWKQNILHISIMDGNSGTNVRYDIGSKKNVFSLPSKYDTFLRSGSYSFDASLVCLASDSISKKKNDSVVVYKDSVTIVEVSTGNIRAKLPLSGKTLGVFSPDGKLLATEDNQKRISLWNAHTFDFIRSLPVQGQKISVIEFSSDSQKMAYCLNDTTIQIFDIPSNRIVASINGHSKEIVSLVFSPNGQKIYSTSNDSTLKAWDVSRGELVRSYGVFPATTCSIAVSPDGRTLALTTYPSKRKIYLLDAETGRLLHTLQGGVPGNIGELSFDEKYRSLISTRKEVLSSFLGNLEDVIPEQVHQWDFSALANPVAPIRKKSLSSRTDLYRTSNDSLILCEHTDSLAYFWNVASKKILRTIALPPNIDKISYAAISNDEKSAVTVSLLNRGSILRLYDVSTGRLKWQDSSRRQGVKIGGKFVVFSKNDSLLFVHRMKERTSYLAGLQVSTGKLVFDIPAEIPYFLDSNRFSWVGSKDTVFNLQTLKKEKYPYKVEKDLEVLSVAEDVMKARKPNGDTTILHLPTQKFLPNRFAKDWYSITRDGKFAFRSESASILIVDAATGRDLCNLYTLDSTNWAVTTPDGRFDGSEGGLRYLHFVVGNEPIELEQLKERYYEPGLFSKLMGYNNEPLRTIERFDSVKLYPRVSLQAASSKKDVSKSSVPKKQSKTTKSNSRGLGGNEQSASASSSAPNLTFSVQLTNQGGGIGRVPVWLNGKELTDDARPKNTRADAAEMSLTLNLEGNRLLLPGTTNTLTVRAFNGENGVVSRSTTLEFYAPGERLQSAPHLYAVIGGTSDYQGEELDLPFASSDAEQIAKAVQIAGERLLGADRVHISLLASKPDSTKSLTRTTKSNLVNALKAVQQKATPNDILFVYLTGHGINWGGQDGDWYYLTCDARLGDDEKFTDAALRSSVSLSSHELTDLMKAIPARKQTLALDACASGKAVENLLTSRDVPSSQLRAMMRMKDRAGLHVISGCASNAVSYEASRYGQGLLTYSLLMGMKGGALRDNQFVDVKQLFEFAADRVPELARDIGRIQKPQVCSPFGGGSFDIGLVTESEAKSIPLADAKPLFVRANFQDEKKMYDQLNLGKMVNESLRGVTYRTAVNPFEAWLVYLDVPEFPNSYSLNGRYAIKGEEITVSAVLRKGEEEGTVFSVKGTTNNLGTLAKALISETQKRMK